MDKLSVRISIARLLIASVAAVLMVLVLPPAVEKAYAAQVWFKFYDINMNEITDGSEIDIETLQQGIYIESYADCTDGDPLRAFMAVQYNITQSNAAGTNKAVQSFKLVKTYDDEIHQFSDDNAYFIGIKHYLWFVELKPIGPDAVINLTLKYNHYYPPVMTHQDAGETSISVAAGFTSEEKDDSEEPVEAGSDNPSVAADGQPEDPGDGSPESADGGAQQPAGDEERDQVDAGTGSAEDPSDASKTEEGDGGSSGGSSESADGGAQQPASGKSSDLVTVGIDGKVRTPLPAEAASDASDNPPGSSMADALSSEPGDSDGVGANEEKRDRADADSTDKARDASRVGESDAGASEKGSVPDEPSANAISPAVKDPHDGEGGDSGGDSAQNPKVDEWGSREDASPEPSGSTEINSEPSAASGGYEGDNVNQGLGSLGTVFAVSDGNAAPESAQASLEARASFDKQVAITGLPFGYVALIALLAVMLPAGAAARFVLGQRKGGSYSRLHGV